MAHDDYDIDTNIAYYLFVNHGIMPSTVLELSAREKALIIAFAERQKESLDKMDKKS